VTCVSQKLFVKHGGTVTNTWALVASAELPAVTHVLCRRVRCSAPPVTSHRLHCGTVPSHRPPLATIRSQVVQLSYAAMKIGVSTEKDALQQLQGEPRSCSHIHMCLGRPDPSRELRIVSCGVLD
jgi:hypothetical protein